MSKRDRLGWLLVAVGLVVLSACTGHGDGGQPAAPPSQDRRNKILWVARVSEGGDPLRITARLAGSDVVVRRQVEGGSGPSMSTCPPPAAGAST